MLRFWNIIRLCQPSRLSRRLFSIGGLILTLRRNSLSYAAFQKLLTLKTNGSVVNTTVVPVLHVNLLDVRTRQERFKFREFFKLAGTLITNHNNNRNIAWKVTLGTELAHRAVLCGRKTSATRSDTAVPSPHCRRDRLLVSTTALSWVTVEPVSSSGKRGELLPHNQRDLRVWWHARRTTCDWTSLAE